MFDNNTPDEITKFEYDELQRQKENERIVAASRSLAQVYDGVGSIIKTHEINVQSGVGAYNATSLASILSAHENGSFNSSAIFSESELMSDSRISNALTIVKSMILDTWDEDSVEIITESEEARSVASWWKRNLFNIFDASAIMYAYMDKFFLGFGVSQILYTAESFECGPKLVRWHPALVQYFTPARSFAIWAQNSATKKMGMEYITSNAKWNIWSNSNRETGYYRCWVDAGIKQLGDLYLKKKFAALDWSRFSELYGNPVKKLYMPADASEVEKQMYMNSLKQMTSESILPLLTGKDGAKLWDMELLKTQDSNPDVMKDMIDKCDKAIDIAILGTSNIIDGAVGPYGYTEAILESVVGAKPRLEIKMLEKDVNVCVKNISEAIFGDVIFAPKIRIRTKKAAITEEVQSKKPLKRK